MLCHPFTQAATSFLSTRPYMRCRWWGKPQTKKDRLIKPENSHTRLESEKFRKNETVKLIKRWKIWVRKKLRLKFRGELKRCRESVEHLAKALRLIVRTSSLWSLLIAQLLHLRNYSVTSVVTSQWRRRQNIPRQMRQCNKMIIKMMCDRELFIIYSCCLVTRIQQTVNVKGVMSQATGLEVPRCWPQYKRMFLVRAVCIDIDSVGALS